MKTTIKAMSKFIFRQLCACNVLVDYNDKITSIIETAIEMKLGAFDAKGATYIDIVDVEEEAVLDEMRKDISAWMEPGSVERLSPDTMSKGNEKVIEEKIQALLAKYKGVD